MKKYQKPMLIGESIPNTDTAITSCETNFCDNNGDDVGPFYAPGQPYFGVVGKWYQLDPDHFYYCNGNNGSN